MFSSSIARLVVAASLAMLFGCAPPEPARAPLNELASRAAYELDCPAQWLRLTDIDERVKGVDGCGKRATYVEVCQGAGACSWWNNTSPAPGAFQGSAASPAQPYPAQPASPYSPQPTNPASPARWR
jgi:hypothetical protein